MVYCSIIIYIYAYVYIYICGMILIQYMYVISDNNICMVYMTLSHLSLSEMFSLSLKCLSLSLSLSLSLILSQMMVTRVLLPLWLVSAWHQPRLSRRGNDDEVLSLFSLSLSLAALGMFYCGFSSGLMAPVPADLCSLCWPPSRGLPSPGVYRRRCSSCNHISIA
jgi:hypothetical protein